MLIPQQHVHRQRATLLTELRAAGLCVHICGRETKHELSHTSVAGIMGIFAIA